MSRFLVTGCAGFIGSHLTDALLAEGHDVRGVDAFTEYYPRELKERNLGAARGSERFSLIQSDVATDPLEALVSEVDGIFHLAAQPGVRGSWGSAFRIHLQHNVLATQRILEAAAGSGVRLLLVSSSSVYGNALGYPTTEATPTRPISPYGVSKLACEHLVSAYAEARFVDAVTLRYFTVYGPRQRPDMAFSRIFASLRAGGRFQVLGDGHQSRDATFVGDAVSATIAAFLRGRAGGIYNVGGGSEATLLEVVAIAEQIAGRRLALDLTDPAAGDVRRTCADTSSLRSDTGWRPVVTLEQGLAAQAAAALEPAAESRLEPALEAA